MRAETILIVDDEKLIRFFLNQKLISEGFTVVEAETVEEAYNKVIEYEPDVIILDQHLPDGTGLELINKLREIAFNNPIIMLSILDSSNVAVQAMKLGAYDYITKPIDSEELIIVVEKSLESSRMKKQIQHLQNEQVKRYSDLKMIGDSLPMRNLFKFISKIAVSSSTTVLVTGESGVGKEIVVRRIHASSDRYDKPFMAVNCASLTETLIESELFGYQKGAFTDAKTTKQGIFELANGGTIFLDEIGEITPSLQVKLLRVLDQKSFKRVGGTSDISIDVRIIAATNQPIEQMVQEGKFRADLFYRLNVVHLNIPPLRERNDDVLLLAQYFMEQFNVAFRKCFKGLSDETKRLFLKYNWPGNVRELKNVIERAVLLDEGEYIFSHQVELGHLHNLSNPSPFVSPHTSSNEGLALGEIEKIILIEALEKVNFNQSEAAKLLKISRDQVRYKMKKFGLTKIKDLKS